jgi:predicted Zn-dependent peptidase
MKYNLNNLNVKKKIYKLKNGINVILVPLDNTNLVNIDIKFKLGSLDEYYCKCPELVHYMEHLVSYFTSKKYKSHKTINDILYKNNAYKNAYTDNNQVSFYINGLYNSIDIYLDIISNGIFNFYLDKSIINNEKKAVYNELNNNFFSSSFHKFNRKLFKYLYKDKSYYIIKSRTNKSINYLKKYNTNNITKFIKDYLLNAKTILTVSYDKSNTKEVIKLINKYFNIKINKNKSKIRKTKLKFKNNKLKVVYLKNTSSANKKQNVINFIIFYKIIKDSKRFLCLTYLLSLFNDFNYSIFNNILRRKLGLIYSISFNIDIDYSDYNYSSINISTNCLKENLPKLIYEILNIFDNILSKDDFTQKTLNILYKNKIRDLSFIDKNDISYFGDLYSQELLFMNKVKDIKDRIEIYKSITLKDLRKEFEILKHNLLNKGIIFYNGNVNLNKKIEKINNRKFKINYVSF